MTLPVYVTGGASANRWIQITETTGADISGDTVKVALLPFRQKPAASDARNPVSVQHPATNVVKAAIVVDNTYTPGMYTLWARIEEAPELDWLEGGLVEVL